MHNLKYLLAVSLIVVAPLAAQEPTNSSAGLSCKIVVPSSEHDRYGQIAAKLTLTNDSQSVIRVCVIDMGFRGPEEKPAEYFAQFDPEAWKSDAPSFEQIAREVKTLAPGQSVDLPFDIVGKELPVDVVASYHVSEQCARRLNVWHGYIKAKFLLRSSGGT